MGQKRKHTDEDKNEESSFDEEKYEREQEEINQQFPDANFSICMDLNDINDVVMEDTSYAIIKCVFNCYCYDDEPRETVYLVATASNDDNKLTNKDLINAMIYSPFNDYFCNHRFLEGFDLEENVDLSCIPVFCPSFGS